ncbi:MAG: ubiquinone/menaquinone biosynthesis methyltransferase [Ktedonobacterales bacterium]|nr:ubiquinone/menaquinone biosynthesis methyltransferase [Ktedonobacterales bacterium]
MFGRIAGVYDLMNRVMTGGMDRRWRDFAARKVALGPGQIALDIGTGTGDLAIAVARRGAPDSRIIGIDFTPEMLALGEGKLQRLGLTDRIELRQGDGEQLDFPNEHFDACCSAFVVRNLADLRQGFVEMRRVVKPGGRVVCLEMSHPRGALFGAGFHLYFDRLVPLLGKVVGRAFDAYSYLPSSVSAFPDAPALKRVMEDAGWQDVRYYYRMGGIVAVHVGTRAR